MYKTFQDIKDLVCGKRHKLSLALFLFSLPLAAQVSNISIDSKGHICATDGGSIWYANDPASLWVSAAPPMEGKCTWINYIAPKTLAACVEKDGAGRVYVSTNNGKTWKAKKLANKSCSAAFFSDECGLWVSFSDMDIFHSMDEGRTWKTVHASGIPSAHITDICMLSPKEGIFGVSNNKILRTTDGGKTFQNVPTPFDQAQRTNSTIANAPVDQIMRIGRFYVAKQGGFFGKYYITSYDNISWHPHCEISAPIMNPLYPSTLCEDNNSFHNQMISSFPQSLFNNSIKIFRSADG